MRYDACLARIQAEGRLPSVAAAVARGGEPVWQGAIGAEPGTSYRIGSITKTMTAVLVLQLRDDGLLALDDPITRFVPESGGDATVRGLLAHTAGLWSEPAGPWWERSPGVNFAELLAANADRGRLAAEGELWHYSNLGYALLGEAVARLRGAPWWDLVQERLLAPLGMAATSYHPPADHAPGRSVDHFAHTLTPEPHTDTRAMAPAGQLWSTAGDLLRWADFLAVGHPDVLSPATSAEMAEPAPGADAYGLGLRLVHHGGRTFVGHTGSMPGFQATLFVDRSSRDAVVALANATTGLLPEEVPGLFLGEDPVAQTEAWRPTREVPAEVAEVLGLWFWGNTALGFEWRHDELVVRDLRTATVSYRFELRDGAFVGIAGYHEGEPLEVHRRADGTVGHLECATFLYTRAPYDPEVYGVDRAVHDGARD